MALVPGEITNKEAAAYLKSMLNNGSLISYARGNGKSTALLIRLEVFMKAIEALEKTPD